MFKKLLGLFAAICILFTAIPNVFASDEAEEITAAITAIGQKKDTLSMINDMTPDLFLSAVKILLPEGSTVELSFSKEADFRVYNANSEKTGVIFANICFTCGPYKRYEMYDFVIPKITGATAMAGSAECSVGEAVSVPIILSGNTGFSNIALEIGYDRTALELVGAEPNTSVGANFTKAQTLDAYPYNMSWDSAANNNFNGTLVTLVFNAKKAGTYPITVDYYKGRNGDYIDGDSVNYDENFDSLRLGYLNGSVTIKGSTGGGMAVGGISFNVTLSGDTNIGTVYAAIYDADDNLRYIREYPAQEKLTVTFDKGETGDYAKIMWWDEKMTPMCGSEKIPL